MSHHIKETGGEAMPPNESPGSADTLHGAKGKGSNRRPNYSIAAAPDNRAALRAVRPHPTKPGFWLVNLDGHPEFTIRDAKLRSLKRFRNVAQFRLGISFDCESVDVWQARVDAAIREGGAS
jgi:hypothetical protein